jgi:hypothetical protein
LHSAKAVEMQVFREAEIVAAIWNGFARETGDERE